MSLNWAEARHFLKYSEAEYEELFQVQEPEFFEAGMMFEYLHDWIETEDEEFTWMDFIAKMEDNRNGFGKGLKELSVVQRRGVFEPVITCMDSREAPRSLQSRPGKYVRLYTRTIMAIDADGNMIIRHMVVKTAFVTLKLHEVSRAPLLKWEFIDQDVPNCFPSRLHTLKNVRVKPYTTDSSKEYTFTSGKLTFSVSDCP